MPILCVSVDGRVLAHWRDNDPVLKLKLSKLPRREETCHLDFPCNLRKHRPFDVPSSTPRRHELREIVVVFDCKTLRNCTTTDRFRVGSIGTMRTTAFGKPSIAAQSRQPETSQPVQTDSGDAASLKQVRFPSLTDRMIAYGPAAAAAVLAYLEAPEKGRTRPALSPKSREGLAWVRAVKGEPPLRLRNALEHLLLNLKTSGVDLDDLFVSFAAPPPISSQPTRSKTVPKKEVAESGGQKC